MLRAACDRRAGSPRRSSPVDRLVLAGLAVALASACGPEVLPPERVVLVTIDTLRADHVGSYGAHHAHTPRMDTVAAAGVRFAHAVSPAPLTLPAHASLLTALDPPAHGVRHNSVHRLAEGIPTLAEALRDAGYATAAFVGALVLDRRFGLGRGFDVYDDALGGRRSGAVGYAERRADAVVDAVLAWLDGAPDRFFLWVHFYDPHTAYDPPAGFRSAFASHPYAGEIAFADAQLGRLLDALHARWGESGLLVAVTSDHGESLGEHGELTHSYTLYDATQRVPLLLAGPGLPRGAAVEAPVRLIDVAPTLLALAGAEPLPGAAGRDLRPLMAGREPEPRIAYLETLATQLDFRWSPLVGVRSDRYKYIRAPRPELYDLIADPGELANRAQEEPDLVARLECALDARLAAARAPEAAAGLAASDRARLRSLGYIAAAVPGVEPDDLGVVGGPDPKDRIGALRALAEAETLLTAGEPHRALERLETLAEEGVAVEALRAAAAIGAGDVKVAERAARAVLAQDPARADVALLLGRALEAQERIDEAAAAYAGAVEGSAEARERLALLQLRRGARLEEQGLLEQALEAREAALALLPDGVGTRNDVAWTLALLGRDLDRALALARAAAQDSGGDPRILDTLAQVRRARGDP